MAILDIRKAGDPVLKQKAAPVEKVTKKIKELIESMAETMYAADGVGLAAPQIGVSQRIIVINVGDGLIGLVNPVIVEQEGLECAAEGCLSIPGVFGDVERASRVTVEALDRNGKPVRIMADRLLARALQHEIDHLEGVLFIERSSTIYKGNK
jgi:peptide deformylase